MKKLLFIISVFFSINSFAQTIDTLASFGTGSKGNLIYYQHYTVPNTVKYYFNGFGAFAQLNTDSIIEGSSNLFYTNARARAALSLDTTAGSPSSYNSSTGVFHILTGSASGGSGWGLTGNSGLSYLTNFFGTTDAQSIYFKTNGVVRAKIDSVGKTFIDSTYFGRGNTISLSSARYSSIAIGDSALSLNTSGTNNTAIGDSALRSNTTGTNNVAVGYLSLWKSSTGGANVAIGASSMGSGVNTGTDNIALGVQSLFRNSSGNHNFAAGQAVLQNNTTGSSNIGIGQGASSNNTTGSDDIAIGDVAMGSGIVTGSNNVGIGNGALQSLTSGTMNVGMGNLVMNAVTTGGNNTAMGRNALLSTTTESGNAAFGAQAGRYSTGSNQIYINTLDRLSFQKDKNGSPFYSQVNLTVFNQLTNLNGRVGIDRETPTAWLHLPKGSSVAGSAPLKLEPPLTLTTTAASGTGATATLTFATTTIPAFVIGSTIVVSGVTPSGFNGTFVVTDVSPTTVSYANSTVGPQTVAGTIVQGQLLTILEEGAIERDSLDTYFTSGTNANLTRRKDVRTTIGGANATVGTATLSSGTVTVSTTAVLAGSKIFLTDATTGSLTNVGTLTVGTITGGTSFVINSTNILDASNVNWFIINP